MEDLKKVSKKGPCRKKNAGLFSFAFVLLLFMFPVLVLAQEEFPTEAVQPAETPAEPDTETMKHVREQMQARTLQSLSIAKFFVRADTLEEVLEATERLNQALDRAMGMPTGVFIAISKTYLDALDRTEARTARVSFASIQGDRQRMERLRAEYEPVTQEIFNFMAKNALVLYLKGNEVFEMADILKRVVRSPHLSEVTQQEVMDMIINIHLQNSQNIDSFLKKHVVKRILTGNESVRRTVSEALEKDLLTEELLTEENREAEMEVREIIEREMMGTLNGRESALEGPKSRRIDLYESREGFVEGRLFDPTTEKGRRARIESIRMSARRGRH